MTVPVSPADTLRGTPRLPAAPESEAAFCGCVMAAASSETEAIGLEIERLTPSDFTTPDCRTIFSAIKELSRTGHPTDSLGVVNALRAAGKLESVGGPGALALLVDSVPSLTEAARYAGEILGAARRRKRIGAAQRFAETEGRGGADNGEVEALRAALDESSAAKSPAPRVVEVSAASALMAEPEEDRTSHFAQKWYYPASGSGVGDPRSGKGVTFLNILLRSSLGLGLGPGAEAVQRASCVYWTAEDTRPRLRRRLKEMCLGLGVDPEDVKRLHIACCPRPAIRLPEDLDLLKRTLDPFEPRFVVLDHLHRLHVGRDSNNADEMAPVCEAIEEIRDHFGAAIETIMHTSKSPNSKRIYRGRGSGEIIGRFDHQILFSRDDKLCTLEFCDSREDDDWEMTFLEKRLDNGGLVYELQSNTFDGDTARTIEGRAKVQKALEELSVVQPKGIATPLIEEAVGMVRRTVVKYLESLCRTNLAVKIPGNPGEANRWKPTTGGAP